MRSLQRSDRIFRLLIALNRIRDERRQGQAGVEDFGRQMGVHELQQFAEQHGRAHRNERVASDDDLDERIEQSRLEETVQQEGGVQFKDVWHTGRQSGQNGAALHVDEAIAQAPRVMEIARIDGFESDLKFVGPRRALQSDQFVEKVENRSLQQKRVNKAQFVRSIQ